MQEIRNVNENSFFSCNSYNFDLEKLFFYFSNQLSFMSKNKHIFSIKKILNPSFNLDNQYFVRFKSYPYYTAIIGDKIKQNSSFIKIVNRIFYVQNTQNQSLSFQIIYTFYDNTCENKILSQMETILLSQLNNNEMKLYHNFIGFTKHVFSHYLKNFYNENVNQTSYVSESISIHTSTKKLFNFLKNIENILKILYWSYKWKKISNNIIQIFNHETKINTICTLQNIMKLNNSECVNFEIKKHLRKENEINIIYITHFKINPISENLCWLCCDYPIPFGTLKSSINNMTSVCKYLIKKIKENLEVNN